MKRRFITYLVKMVKFFKAEKLFFNTPSSFIATKEWVEINKSKWPSQLILLENSDVIKEEPPVVVGHSISGRFTRYYQRASKETFVAIIPGAKLLGEFSNIIITPDNLVLSDVSREFGAEGGRKPKSFSVFNNRARMPEMIKLQGKIAVVSTHGANNFHHWNYDVLPRLDLLKRAGVIPVIDKFIICHKAQKFQLEGLSKLGIPSEKIINPSGDERFFVEADYLYIPSLPEDLGTISPWVVDFLRNVFLTGKNRSVTNKMLFLSRKKAPSRKIINQDEVSDEVLGRGFVEFIPEDFSMEEVAEYFSEAKSIVSVHGSGLSNLAFIEHGACVLDIMAPYHQDPYYWMICNQRGAKYVALFAEGKHPADELDLVTEKVDDDLLIDMGKLKKALDLIS